MPDKLLEDLHFRTSEQLKCRQELGKKNIIEKNMRTRERCMQEQRFFDYINDLNCASGNLTNLNSQIMEQLSEIAEIAYGFILFDKNECRQKNLQSRRTILENSYKAHLYKIFKQNEIITEQIQGMIAKVKKSRKE